MPAERLTGFVLKRRWYLEKKLLVDWFTKERGRVTSSIRMPERIKMQDLALITGIIHGNNSFVKIDGLEILKIYPATRKNLWLVFYLNELLLKFLPVNEVETAIFEAYQNVLSQLSVDSLATNIAVRLFEKKILTNLGYGFNFCDVNGQALVNHKKYRFIYKQGFVETQATSSLVFSGGSLLALANEQITDDTLSEVTRLLKYVLHWVLEGRSLRTRQVYREMYYV